MIAKHVAMKSAKKSDFAELVRYLTGEQGKQERVGAVTVANCVSSAVEAAILEVTNTQAQNTRARSDKTFHMIVSFAPGEQPDEVVLREIERRICDGIGFGEHQRVIVVHHDTDILHMHIAINKIHPTRYTINEPFNVFHTLGRLCTQLEGEFNLQVTNHTASKSIGENHAADMEHQAAQESLLGWVRRECSDRISTSQSWAGLHRTLSEYGLELQARGNGLVVVDRDGLSVKASSIHRDFSRKRLEAKLGEFEAPDQRAAPKLSARYEKGPMHSVLNSDHLYARYKEDQQARGASRTVEWAHAAARKKRLIEDAKRRGKLKRSAIKLMKGAGPVRKLLYGMTSTTLRAEIADINKQYREARQEVYEKYSRRTWADWLQADATAGNQEALAVLRARRLAHERSGNTIAAKGSPETGACEARPDGVTKTGTVIYKAGTTAVRDDGQKLQVSRGADPPGLLFALQLAMERYGNRMAVHGTQHFKEQIATAAAAASLRVSFDDAGLERRRQELMQNANIKEHANGPAEQGRSDRGRHARGGGTSADRTKQRTQHGRGRGRAAATTGSAKPNLGGIGREPPPSSQNRLRGLRELGVVQLTLGAEVLLPRHVPDHLEQQGTPPDNSVRWHVAGTGLTAASASQAAAKYVLEREQRRLSLFDIPKHSQYTFDNNVTAEFGGIRRIDGHALVLVKRSDEIAVVPIDDATARRLRRIAIGAEITVKTDGRITATKGRSR